MIAYAFWPFKVIDFCTNWKPTSDFLLVILHVIMTKALSLMRWLQLILIFNATRHNTCSKISHKTRSTNTKYNNKCNNDVCKSFHDLTSYVFLSFFPFVSLYFHCLPLWRMKLNICTYDEVGHRFLHGWQHVDAAVEERTFLTRSLITTIEYLYVTWLVTWRWRRRTASVVTLQQLHQVAGPHVQSLWTQNLHFYTTRFSSTNDRRSTPCPEKNGATIFSTITLASLGGFV